jgi:hypothetical protein
MPTFNPRPLALRTNENPMVLQQKLKLKLKLNTVIAFNEL